ncbi:MAG: pyridoxal 5'-phosphate synthase glutaminase subunit PdxT [Candidatus Acetothermia bacterium]
MKVGVLALQGDFREHVNFVEELGEEAVLVRRPGDLKGLDGLIIPGGESTTISSLARKWNLFERIRKAVGNGLPVFGTCAGLILLADKPENGPRTLELMDVTVERNAYGRQIESFEAELEVEGINGLKEEPLHGVFIRAPQVVRLGEGVEVLARYGDQPVLLRENGTLGATFHPELTDDKRVHEHFLSMIEEGWLQDET